MSEKANYGFILAELELIADRTEFERSAVENENFADEVFCILFDDLRIESFLASFEFDSKEELEALSDFVRLAKQIADSMKSHIDGAELVNNDHWKKAQSIAQDLVELHNRQKGG